VPRIVETETNEITARVFLDNKEVERILGEYAVTRTNVFMELDDPRVSFKVDFEDATEGSPSYKVGTKAVVTIKRDMRPVAK